jgi:hypothetical protein
MLKFRTRPRTSSSVRVGPFRLRVIKPLGKRGRGWGAVGARAGRRGWLRVSTPLGRASARKRRWR